mgnify:CR=1 FL=1
MNNQKQEGDVRKPQEVGLLRNLNLAEAGFGSFTKDAHVRNLINVFGQFGVDFGTINCGVEFTGLRVDPRFELKNAVGLEGC